MSVAKKPNYTVTEGRLWEILFGKWDHPPCRYRHLDVRTYTGDEEYPDNAPVEAGTYIVLQTRTGGGNRKDYKCCYKSLWNHPQFVEDWDWEGDETYAEFAFAIPDEHRTEVLGISD
jgi:hypothetical protein